MQTFLPYPDYIKTAVSLDQQRLGKQRVETLQILNTLTGRSAGWQTHPAVRMWRGYTPQLVGYGLAICQAWRHRGYQDTVHDKITAIAVADGLVPTLVPPGWVTPELCLSHRSNLAWKFPEWYLPRYGWDTPMDLEYIWPNG